MGDICNGKTETSQQSHSPTTNSKRLDYISWHEYFMATAFLAAKRSKDPVTQVGACIVNEENKIVGIGYNGMPIGCNDDDFPWGKEGKETKHLYVCHAEMNAIVNKNSTSLNNCRMYVALFPCNECAKFVIQSGIREVIYMSDKYAYKRSTVASKKMFDAAGVKYWQYVPKNNKLIIDFSEINWTNMQQVPISPFKNNEEQL
ncbi:hypothetical protein RI129_007881 [Pyrocoelia pectoralis]|uniref:Probable deoxycytidylate deaminase n=1 Tax=Pyrocoelia pectoralis TaxID=417401 RepID=A0AAN7VEE7_9COLE